MASNSEFSSCKYDIHLMKHGEKCLDRYADLRIFGNVFNKKDLHKNIDPEFVMKFLILCYTPSSPFVKEFSSDLKTRKTKVLNYLGIENNAQLTKEIQDVVTLKHVGVCSRWIMFLRIQCNEDWTYLVNAQERYNKLLEESVQISRKKDKKTGDDLDDLDAMEEKRKNEMLSGVRKQIKEGMDAFLAGEKSKILDEFVNFSLLSESCNIMPEQYIPIWATTNRLPYDLNETGL